MVFEPENLDIFTLLCTEDGFEDNVVKIEEKSSTFFEYDVFWEHDEVLSLLAKEKESLFRICNVEGRKEAVEWILKVVRFYGFGSLTGVLAVGYYDRFVASGCFLEEKPWMSQLVAVACLSIAAKMEEIQVPLLLDLQVEECKYVFEAKTIMRMELLVLSSLKWRTSVVTPISFFDHFVRRFGLWINHDKDFLTRCEQILLSLIVDSRVMGYRSSVIATGIMLFVFNEIDPGEVMDYPNQLLDILGIDKEEVEEVMGSHCFVQSGTRKRKQMSIPGSPIGVIDAFTSSCDSSNDSWAVTSSFLKRSKAQDPWAWVADIDERAELSFL